MIKKSNVWNARCFPAMAVAFGTLCLGSTHAANVLFVTDGSPAPTKDIRNVLTNAGHTVTDFNGSFYGWNLGSNNGVAYANGFDLIVHSRNVNDVYSTLAPHGAVWNALTTPAITLDVFRTGGEFGADSWSWGSPVNSGLPTSTAAGDTYTVTVPSDPILTGITLTGGATPALLNGTGRYWDLGAGASPLTGVTVIAHQPGDPLNVAIAYAAPGALQPGGAAQYFMVGGNFGETDENIFTADGEQIFLNAVDFVAIPEPSTIFTVGIAGLVLLRRRRG